ncbi:nuclear transport factor 2 family protein [Streptomyces luteireticuli]|uniref:SnoaL-like domain-containing protein n=1 Tax=Streptomyces luteireticuli TaxID=173858 RepID=A0ABN0YF21_9ACTN
MSDADVVRRMYAAKGDREVLRSVIAEDAEYDIAEGFPNGGVYHGLDSIVDDFFSFTGDFDEFRAEGDEFWEADGTVFVLGRYRGRARSTGAPFTSRFAHVFTLRDGRIVRLRQTTDTVQIARALGR